MPRSTFYLRLVLASCITSFACSSSNMTPSPSPGGWSVSLSAVSRGSYESDGVSTGLLHSDSNYVAGDCNIVAICLTGPIEYRNWFQFDLSSVTTAVTAATLQVNPGVLVTDCAPQPCSPAPTATYTLFDVSAASIAALGTNSTAIWADLGSGTSYGSLTASAPLGSLGGGNGPIVSIPLNAAAVAAINANRGTSFVLGGAVTTLTGGSERVLLFVSGGIKPLPMSTILQLQ
jgi:hypothetical protein